MSTRSSSSKLLLLCFLLSVCFIATFTTASPVDAINNLEQRDDHVKRQNLAPVRGAALASTSTSRLAPVRRPITTTSSKTTIRTTSTSRRTTSTTKRSTSATSTPRTTTKASTSIPRTTTSSAAATNTAPANSAFASNILQAHNSARSTHGGNALTWSTSAEALAKTWAEKCVWQHGGASGLGQNLAASAGYKQTGQQVVDAWMSEESDYNPSSPTYSHFTQVVWKSTTAVGCYQATCSKLVNPDGSETFPGFSPSYFTVCNYSPPGNVQGQYAQNVQKNN